MRGDEESFEAASEGAGERGGACGGAGALSDGRGGAPASGLTEREKLERGLWYDANFDEELCALRTRADDLCFDYNGTRPSDAGRRAELIDRLIPDHGAGLTVLSPVYVDYGHNVHLGENVFINHNCYLMDGAPITLGDSVFVGPNCGFYTATHAYDAAQRASGLERAEPISVGDDVWFGAGVSVMPGVEIGAGSIIGAGSVVTRDIPAGVIAVGSPCRVVRAITEADRVAYRR